MKIQYSVLAVVSLVTAAFAQLGWADCRDVRRAQQMATDATLALHKISTGSRPLTYEAHSLDSRPDTFGVILSYSGVEYVYQTTVRPMDCFVTQIVLTSDR